MAEPIDETVPAMKVEIVCKMQDKVREVRVEDSIYDYIVSIISATRSSEQLSLGASPRTSLRLFRGYSLILATEVLLMTWKICKPI